DELVVLQCLDHRRYDAGDVAHEANVQRLTGLLGIIHELLAGPDETAVFAGKTHGLAAGLVAPHDDVLLYLAAQHPFHDFHGLGVGDAHALDEGAFLADALQGGIDLRAATVNDHGVDAYQLEQHDVVREAALQMLFRHCVAAVFDDHGFPVETADIRQ